MLLMFGRSRLLDLIVRVNLEAILEESERKVKLCPLDCGKARNPFEGSQSLLYSLPGGPPHNPCRCYVAENEYNMIVLYRFRRTSESLPWVELSRSSCSIRRLNINKHRPP